MGGERREWEGGEVEWIGWEGRGERREERGKGEKRGVGNTKWEGGEGEEESEEAGERRGRG